MHWRDFLLDVDKIRMSSSRRQSVVIVKSLMSFKVLVPQFFLAIFSDWRLHQSSPVEKSFTINKRLEILIPYLLNRHNYCTTLRRDCRHLTEMSVESSRRKFDRCHGKNYIDTAIFSWKFNVLYFSVVSKYTKIKNETKVR